MSSDYDKTGQALQGCLIITLYIVMNYLSKLFILMMNHTPIGHVYSSFCGTHSTCIDSHVTLLLQVISILCFDSICNALCSPVVSHIFVVLLISIALVLHTLTFGSVYILSAGGNVHYTLLKASLQHPFIICL